MSKTPHSNEDNSVPEANLASFCSDPEVYLQTLRVILYNGPKQKIVRILIDQGSMRTCASEKVIQELGYEAKGKLEIIHSLFGGVTTKTK